MSAALAAPGSGRAPAVDVLKSLGIVAVVFIHSVRSPWDPAAAPLEIWLGRLAHFAVPGFLAASGFLYARSREPGSESGAMRRRLARILVPYLVASIAAQLWWMAQGDARAPAEWARELLLASSFGPYYYVFQITTLVVLTPLVARVPRAALLPLTALCVLAQLFVNSLGLPLFWGLRFPLFSAGSFLLGWSLRVYSVPIGRLLAERRTGVVGGLAGFAVLCAAGMAAGLPELADRACEWAYVNVVIVAVFVAWPERATLPDGVRRLSDSTYAIFLIHLFFVYEVAKLRPLAPGEFDVVGVAIHWAVGLGGAFAAVALARRALGPRARLLLGA